MPTHQTEPTEDTVMTLYSDEAGDTTTKGRKVLEDWNRLSSHIYDATGKVRREDLLPNAYHFADTLHWDIGKGRYSEDDVLFIAKYMPQELANTIALRAVTFSRASRKDFCAKLSAALDRWRFTEGADEVQQPPSYALLE